eukprot:104444_1
MAQSNTEPASTWECIFCTYINKDLTLRNCYVCEKTRDESTIDQNNEEPIRKPQHNPSHHSQSSVSSRPPAQAAQPSGRLLFDAQSDSNSAHKQPQSRPRRLLFDAQSDSNTNSHSNSFTFDNTSDDSTHNDMMIRHTNDQKTNRKRKHKSDADIDDDVYVPAKKKRKINQSAAFRHQSVVFEAREILQKYNKHLNKTPNVNLGALGLMLLELNSLEYAQRLSTRTANYNPAETAVLREHLLRTRKKTISSSQAKQLALTMMYRANTHGLRSYQAVQGKFKTFAALEMNGHDQGKEEKEMNAKAAKQRTSNEIEMEAKDMNAKQTKKRVNDAKHKNKNDANKRK